MARDFPVLRLSGPATPMRTDAGMLLSEVAKLVAGDVAVSKADLVQVTGLARSTVTGAVDALLSGGIFQITGARPTPGRGRPAERLSLSPNSGVVLIADLAAAASRLAIVDLQQQILANERLEYEAALGPREVLELIADRFRTLRDETCPAVPVRQLVIGLPSPVDSMRGLPVRPPRVPGWHNFRVRDELSRMLGCPVWLENDVNLRALGEARALPADQQPLIFVKVGAGIGGGLVGSDGRLHYGADGGAGDVGHVRLLGAEARPCVCGNVGCVEAVASLSAITRSLQALPARESVAVKDSNDVLELIRRGDPTTMTLVRESGELVGELIAMLVHFYNPARVALGGAITAASDEFLAAVRAVVYQRALPLGTRNLVLSASALGDHGGIAGATVLGVERALSPRGRARLLT